jgi:phosphatidylserine/phosphatidylglycerophosphate/cardiolipin synthase-like enzyme
MTARFTERLVMAACLSPRRAARLATCSSTAACSWTRWRRSTQPSSRLSQRACEGGPAGVLHAKAVVADDEAVFVTSTNLTEAALDRNIELGVLLRDRALALTVSGYFRSLIDRDLLKPLPLA